MDIQWLAKRRICAKFGKILFLAKDVAMLALRNPNDEEAAPPRSQASLAYDLIRRGILSGRHTPGTKLKIQDLADELDVSPGAIREALSRLVPEQLVVSRDQRGFIVAPLSVADLEDLTDLRCEVEGIALRRSVERGDVHWEADILAAAHRLRALKISAKRDSEETDNLLEEWGKAHAAFHNALIKACGSRRLLTLHAQLYEQSERYRMQSFFVESARDVDSEHQEIVDLALARDADGLVSAMAAHIRETTRLIIANAAREAA